MKAIGEIIVTSIIMILGAGIALSIITLVPIVTGIIILLIIGFVIYCLIHDPPKPK